MDWDTMIVAADGMTETVMLTSNPYEGERRPGTVGFPLPGQPIRGEEPRLIGRDGYIATDGDRPVLLDSAMTEDSSFADFLRRIRAGDEQAAVELVRRIHEELGLAICVVEHVMEVVMPLSHRVIVLDHGEKLTEGPPADVARDERVITAYLGDRYRARS